MCQQDNRFSTTDGRSKNTLENWNQMIAAIKTSLSTYTTIPKAFLHVVNILVKQKVPSCVGIPCPVSPRFDQWSNDNLISIVDLMLLAWLCLFVYKILPRECNNNSTVLELSCFKAITPSKNMNIGIEFWCQTQEVESVALRSSYYEQPVETWHFLPLLRCWFAA